MHPIRSPRQLITAGLGLGLAGVLAACGQAIASTLSMTSTPTPTPTPLAPGWHRQTLGGGGGQTGIAIHPANSQIVYVTADNAGMVKTLDGGETWFPVNNNLGNAQLGDIAMDPLDPEVLYVTAPVYSERRSWSDDPVTGELYRTRNGGGRWEVVYAEGMGGGDGRSFGVVQWPSTRNILIPYLPADPGRYDRDGDRLSDVIYIGGWDEDQGAPDPRAGVWKSVDEGASFVQLGLAAQKIWVLKHDPADPETLYAGTFEGGLWVSRDGGATWESWAARIPFPMVSDLVVVPGGQTLYVATNAFFSSLSGDEYREVRGIYKSTDAGQTFERINTGLEETTGSVHLLWLDQTDPTGQTLYAGPWPSEGRGIFQTRDGGAHWTEMAFEANPQSFWFRDFSNLWAIEQAVDGTLYAATWRGLYRLDAANQRWLIKSTGLGNIAVRAIALAPDDEATLYLGILDSTPWKSTDRGLTWQRIGEGFRTADGVRSMGASDFAISPTQPQIIYASGIGSSNRFMSGLNKTEDGGQTWRAIITGLPPTTTADPRWQANAVAVNAQDPARAYVALEYAGGGGGLYRTTNGGASWEFIYDLAGRPADLLLLTAEEETLVVATEDGTVHLGVNGGRRWEKLRLPEASGQLYSVDVFPADPRRILVGAREGAYLTLDGGAAWEAVFDKDDLRPFMEELALSDFARARYAPKIRVARFDRQDPQTFYLGHSPSIWMGVGLLKTTDGGATWAKLSDQVMQVRSIFDFDLSHQSASLAAGTWEVYYLVGR